MVHTSRTPAKHYLVARELLLSDQRQGEPSRTDGQIAQTLDISHRTVIRIKQRFVQGSLELALPISDLGPSWTQPISEHAWIREPFCTCRCARPAHLMAHTEIRKKLSLHVSSLCYKLVRKEAQHIQLQDIGEPEDHFLDAGCLQLGQMVADRFWGADQGARGHRAA
jgi:hypothetical protein